MAKSTMTWFDVYLGKFKWYRKLKGGDWWQHQFSRDAMQLQFPPGKTFWARYPKINRYSDIINHEYYNNGKH